MVISTERETKIVVSLSPESAVAMKMIGLEGRKLASEMRKATAIDLFRRGLLSIGQGADLAEVSLAEFMDMLSDRGVPATEYSEEEAEKDLQLLEPNH